MRLILNQEVPHLGEAGDIVKVRSGFGRNYLIPQGLAILANDGSVRELEHQQRVATAIRRKQLAGAQALAKSIEGVAVSIRRETGEDDKLFGSVSNRDIAIALADEGIEVDRRLIKLDNPIRNIGLFNVPIRLHKDIEASVRVYVIRK